GNMTPQSIASARSPYSMSSMLRPISPSPPSGTMRRWSVIASLYPGAGGSRRHRGAHAARRDRVAQGRACRPTLEPLDAPADALTHLREQSVAVLDRPRRGRDGLTNGDADVTPAPHRPSGARQELLGA